MTASLIQILQVRPKKEESQVLASPIVFLNDPQCDGSVKQSISCDIDILQQNRANVKRVSWICDFCSNRQNTSPYNCWRPANNMNNSRSCSSNSNSNRRNYTNDTDTKLRKTRVKEKKVSKTITMNPSASSGRACGLKESTSVSPGAPPAYWYWYRRQDQQYHNPSTLVGSSPPMGFSRFQGRAPDSAKKRNLSRFEPATFHFDQLHMLY